MHYCTSCIQCSLIQTFMLDKFEQAHNTAEPTKKKNQTKGEGTVDHIWFTKFQSDCKNSNDQARLDRPKTVFSETTLQAIEANPESRTLMVSDKFSIFMVQYGFITFTQQKH